MNSIASITDALVNDTDVSEHVTSIIEETYTLPQHVLIKLINIDYYLQMVESFLISPIGVIAGVLNLLVLKRFTQSAFIIYLTAISIVDIIRLTDTFTFSVLFIYFTTWPCKLVYFIAYWSGLSSYTFVAIVSVDRALAVVLPHKVKALSTPGRAKITVYVVLILWLVLTVQMLWTWQWNDHIGCTQYSLLSHIFNIFYMAVNMGVFIIILISSITIVKKLRDQRHLMASLQGDTSQTSLASIRSNKKENQISSMLLSIGILYLCTTLPFSVLIVSDVIFKWSLWNITAVWVFKIGLDVCIILGTLNHSLNFVMYCLSAEMFRKEALALLMGHASVN